jgi:hypothetical protein
MYYDANTGLYFDTTSQQWLALDAITGQFTAPAAEQSAAPSTAADSAIGEFVFSCLFHMSCILFMFAYRQDFVQSDDGASQGPP